MKNKITFLILLLSTSLIGFAQNPYRYETKVEYLNVYDDKAVFGNSQPQRTYNYPKIQELSNTYNSQGYKLTQMNMIPGDGGEKIVLVFERSNSFREAELYKLVSELTTRIDTTSKKYTDSAMVVIQTNVLNYLKSIPNDVITQAYKDELTKIILSEAEDKINKVVEELKKEIRNETNH